ncbi:UNVERIFIED_CONTAM: hypothetical protein Sradi_5248600 [Sesamum radiatum]|uniref:Uncharacterized protein n=1 Tax=Sesamum radiatum TaxID=300843 RepID=A0AAW2LQ56_SESRA
MDRRMPMSVRRTQGIFDKASFAGKTDTKGYPLSLHILDVQTSAGTRRKRYANTHLQGPQQGRKSLTAHKENGFGLGHHYKKLTSLLPLTSRGSQNQYLIETSPGQT